MDHEERRKHRPEAAADADLVVRTRSGDTAAFGELWRRHYRAGMTVARNITSSLDADDLVQEAYTRIYHSIVNGGGPTGSFRAYLFTSIRNTAAAWGRARRETPYDELDGVEDPSAAAHESEAALDRSLTHQAFRSLPTRWQEVLWYSEIERMKPAEIAPLLGMKPTAVAQLTFRAREGLREAWIQAHLGSVANGSECQWTIERLGAYARDNLGRRDHAKLERHLAGCVRCSIVASEAKEVSSRLALVLLPLALGAAGTAGYLASVQGGGASWVALASMPSTVLRAAVTGNPAATVGAAGPTAVAASATGTAASGTATGAGLGAGAAAMTSSVGASAGVGAAGAGAAAVGSTTAVAAVAGGTAFAGIGAASGLAAASLVIVGGVVAAAVGLPPTAAPAPTSTVEPAPLSPAGVLPVTEGEQDPLLVLPEQGPDPADIPLVLDRGDPGSGTTPGDGGGSEDGQKAGGSGSEAENADGGNGNAGSGGGASGGNGNGNGRNNGDVATTAYGTPTNGTGEGNGGNSGNGTPSNGNGNGGNTGNGGRTGNGTPTNGTGNGNGGDTGNGTPSNGNGNGAGNGNGNSGNAGNAGNGNGAGSGNGNSGNTGNGNGGARGNGAPDRADAARTSNGAANGNSGPETAAAPTPEPAPTLP